MEWLFTWGGRCFGYKREDNLWTHDGKHIGKFYDDEIYNPSGNYLGELMNGRLITNLSKKSYKKSGFNPSMSVVGIVKSVDCVGSVMIAGYKDFPKLEE